MTMQKVETLETIRTIEELKAHLISVSKNNPSHVFTASHSFGTTRIFKGKSRSSVMPDSLDSRLMIDEFGGVCFKNGKLLQATEKWMNRHNHIPLRA